MVGRIVQYDDIAKHSVADNMEMTVGPTAPIGGQPGEPSHDAILNAVRTLLRSRNGVELPDHGINIDFDHGVVVTCRPCGVSWRVSRRHFETPAWWNCPTGCRRRR